MSEIYKGFGAATSQEDPVLRHALEHVDTVAFDMHLDRIGNQEQQIIELQKKQELHARMIVEGLEENIAKLFDGENGKSYYHGHFNYMGSFNSRFDQPETWLLYKKYIAIIQPDIASPDNYGLTTDRYSKKKWRRPIPVAILSTSPVSKENQLAYNVYGLADHNSLITRQGSEGLTYLIDKAPLLHRPGIFGGKDIRFPNTPHHIHLVHFYSDREIPCDISIPSAEEVRESYNPNTHSFNLRTDILDKFQPTYEAYEVERVRGLEPEFFEQNPDFTNNLISFLSAHPGFTETVLDELVIKLKQRIARYPTTLASQGN